MQSKVTSLLKSKVEILDYEGCFNNSLLDVALL